MVAEAQLWSRAPIQALAIPFAWFSPRRIVAAMMTLSRGSVLALVSG